MEDKLPQEHKWLEDGRRILTLLHHSKDYPDYVNRSAAKRVDEYIKYVEIFINSPKNSPFTFAQITSILQLYAGIDTLQVKNKFFSSIDLIELTKHFKERSLSSLIGFILSLHRYLRELNSISQRNILIRSIFQEINFDCYIESVNENIRERWEKMTRPEYTYESNATMASVIRNISNFSSRLSMLTDDENVRLYIKKNVSKSFSHIDFNLLGKLMEAQKKGIGSVRGLVDMLRQTSFDDETKRLVQEQFLSELNFKRLALSYNKKPIGNSSFANFCNRYKVTRKTLFANWKVFFETIDFQIPFKLVCFKKIKYKEFLQKFPHAEKILEPFLTEESDSISIDISYIQRENLGNEAFNEIQKHSGFNVTHTRILFQILVQVFKYDKPKLNKVIRQFDFKVIGFRSQNKTPEGVKQLLEGINQLNADKFEYRKFLEGLGIKECRRLFHDGCENLLSTIKKCKFDETELREWVDLEKELDNFQTLIDMAEILTKHSKDYFKSEILASFISA